MCTVYVYLYIGYFHHMYYKDFVRRYQVIAPRALERLRSRAHEMTEVHLHTCIDDRIMTTPTSHFT